MEKFDPQWWRAKPRNMRVRIEAKLNEGATWAYQTTVVDGIVEDFVTVSLAEVGP